MTLGCSITSSYMKDAFQNLILPNSNPTRSHRGEFFFVLTRPHILPVLQSLGCIQIHVSSQNSAHLNSFPIILILVILATRIDSRLGTFPLDLSVGGSACLSIKNTSYIFFTQRHLAEALACPQEVLMKNANICIHLRCVELDATRAFWATTTLCNGA